MKSYLYEMAAGLFLLTVISVLFFIISGVGNSLKQHANRRSLVIKTAIALIAWLAFLGILAQNGFFQNFDALPPRFALANVPPTILAVILLFSTKFNRFLSSVEPAVIIYIQTFRVAVEIVLWLLFLNNTIPGQMTFEGRNFDILVGLSAPFVAYYVSHKKAGYQKVGIVWNILGLGLVLNIVTVAILSAPIPFRMFMNEPANTIVAVLPFIWLPGFLVPVAISFHLFSLKQFLQSRNTERSTNILQHIA